MAKRVLVLCTHNSSRSQMAEGLLRTLAGGQLAVFSAGSEPSAVHPLAVQAMSMPRIDIGSQRSKHVDEYRGQPFDFVLTVCDQAAETCPVFPGKAERIHWGFPDPSVAQGADSDRLSAFIAVRNALERHLADWFQHLTIES